MTVGSILLLLFLLPYLFPGTITGKIKQWTNQSIRGELNFSRARLSFFNHFPALTLTLYDFTLKGSAPFRKDTLVSAEEVALGINLQSIFSKKISIDEIYLTKGNVNIEVNAQGEANYNVYHSAQDTAEKQNRDSGSASLKIERIILQQTHLVYDDRSIPLYINAHGLNYQGTGDLSKAIFDLKTHAEIDSLDLYYNAVPYILAKKINADLITSINTHSLALRFQKNTIHINQLPVAFTGTFEFLSYGYNMDFRLNSKKTDLHDLFTVLPPAYLHWLDKTSMSGEASLTAALSGKYIARNGTMPGFELGMQIRNGFIRYQDAPIPLSGLTLDFQTQIPGLNPDSLHILVDTLSFRMGKNYFQSRIHTLGLTTPRISATIHAALDLGALNRFLGLSEFTLKGNVDFALHADGKFATAVVKKGIRGADTVISAIPAFQIHAALKNGYFKYHSLPEALQNAGFELLASCRDSNFHHTKIAVGAIYASLLSNYIRGSVVLNLAKDWNLDADLHSVLNLSDLKKCLPLDSTQLEGILTMNLRSRGNYNPRKKVFPVTTADLHLSNGFVQTKYYPHPVEKITIQAMLSDRTGQLKNLQAAMLPLSFEFEGKPFHLSASLQNFEDLHYAISAGGVLDIGKIYQVFSKPGYTITGLIQSDFSLKGIQSDATAGRYDKLDNSGTLRIRNLRVTADQFPLPFLITGGTFRFEHEKMWFGQFHAVYGESDFSLSGYLSNVVNYALQPNAPLQGNFQLLSRHIAVDQFRAFDHTAAPATTPVPQNPGVIIIPSNLALTFTAAARDIVYNGIRINDFKGRLVVDSGTLKLDQTGFSLIGAPVTMEGSYRSSSPKAAVFSYHIRAANFDISRAYHQISLFHDLASSAASAHGIVSLDYQLSGRLNDAMHPVYSSLTGGGTLTLEKVQFKGLKLFGAVSRATNRDSLNNPDLSQVVIRSTIANNMITIPRTKMRIFGFRPRVEGQVGFDGRLNLRFRLGLPPFGIFGIPMTITGTSDHPNVRIRKGQETDQLPGPEQQDE